MSANKRSIPKKYRYRVCLPFQNYGNLAEIVSYCFDNFGNRSKKWNYRIIHQTLLDKGEMYFHFTNRSYYTQFILTWANDI